MGGLLTGRHALGELPLSPPNSRGVAFEWARPAPDTNGNIPAFKIPPAMISCRSRGCSRPFNLDAIACRKLLRGNGDIGKALTKGSLSRLPLISPECLVCEPVRRRAPLASVRRFTRFSRRIRRRAGNKHVCGETTRVRTPIPRPEDTGPEKKKSGNVPRWYGQPLIRKAAGSDPRSKQVGEQNLCCESSRYDTNIRNKATNHRESGRYPTRTTGDTENVVTRMAK